MQERVQSEQWLQWCEGLIKYYVQRVLRSGAHGAVYIGDQQGEATGHSKLRFGLAHYSIFVSMF